MTGTIGFQHFLSFYLVDQQSECVNSDCANEEDRSPSLGLNFAHGCVPTLRFTPLSELRCVSECLEESQPVFSVHTLNLLLHSKRDCSSTSYCVVRLDQEYTQLITPFSYGTSSICVGHPIEWDDTGSTFWVYLAYTTARSCVKGL